MNIKRRLEAMEKKAGSLDYLIVYFRTVFEAKDGGIEGEIWKASVVTGPNAGAFVERHSAETFEQFEIRCHALSQGKIGLEEKLSSDRDGVVNTMKNIEFDVISAMEKGREDE